MTRAAKLLDCNAGHASVRARLRNKAKPLYRPAMFPGGGGISSKKRRIPRRPQNGVPLSSSFPKSRPTIIKRLSPGSRRCKFPKESTVRTNVSKKDLPPKEDSSRLPLNGSGPMEPVCSIFSGKTK